MKTIKISASVASILGLHVKKKKRKKVELTKKIS